MTEEKGINPIHDVQKLLVKAGFKIADFRFDLEPRTIVIIRLNRFFEPDRWNEIRLFLRDLGFYYMREKQKFVKGVFR